MQHTHTHTHTRTHAHAHAKVTSNPSMAGLLTIIKNRNTRIVLVTELAGRNARVPVSMRPSLGPPHTHTRARAHTHAHTHTHARARAQCTCTHGFRVGTASHANAHAPTPTPTPAPTPTPTPTRTRTRTIHPTRTNTYEQVGASMRETAHVLHDWTDLCIYVEARLNRSESCGCGFGSDSGWGVRRACVRTAFNASNRTLPSNPT